MAADRVLLQVELCFQFTAHNPQSTIYNPQSTVRNPQSTISAGHTQSRVHTLRVAKRWPNWTVLLWVAKINRRSILGQGEKPTRSSLAPIACELKGPIGMGAQQSGKWRTTSSKLKAKLDGSSDGAAQATSGNPIECALLQLQSRPISRQDAQCRAQVA